MVKLTDGNISYWRMSCRFLQNNTTMREEATSEIEGVWLSRLAEEGDRLTLQERKSIVRWLLKEVKEPWNSLTPEQQKMTVRSLDKRYEILRQSYLNVTPTQAYRHLIDRTCSVIVPHYDLKSWLASSREGRGAMIEVVGRVIQEMLDSDRYCSQQMASIARCTESEQLRNSLLLASLEEYCRRLVDGRPLLLDRFCDYLRLHQQDKSVRLLTQRLMLDGFELQCSRSEHQTPYQYQKVMIEVRYPISA